MRAVQASLKTQRNLVSKELINQKKKKKKKNQTVRGEIP